MLSGEFVLKQRNLWCVIGYLLGWWKIYLTDKNNNLRKSLPPLISWPCGMVLVILNNRKRRLSDEYTNSETCTQISPVTVSNNKSLGNCILTPETYIQFGWEVAVFSLFLKLFRGGISFIIFISPIRYKFLRRNFSIIWKRSCSIYKIHIVLLLLILLT